MAVLTKICPMVIHFFTAYFKRRITSRICWHDASKFSSNSLWWMAFWLFVVFQDLRCLLRMSQLLLRTSQCICLGGHGDSRDSPTSFTALLASNLLVQYSRHCHSNSRFGVTKTLWESLCTSTLGLLGFWAPWLGLHPPLKHKNLTISHLII
jgi:hypothetical protein